MGDWMRLILNLNASNLFQADLIAPVCFTGHQCFESELIKGYICAEDMITKGGTSECKSDGSDVTLSCHSNSADSCQKKSDSKEVI